MPARVLLTLAVMGIALIAAGAALTLFQAETRSLKPIQLVSTPRVAVRVDRSSSFVLLPRDRDALESDGGAATGAATSAMTDTQQIVGRLPRAGSPALDFTLPTLAGGSITLSELRGHPVVINFWTSWCPACRREAPALQAMHAEFAPRGLILLGVNATAQDELSAIRAFVAEFGVTFSILLDEQDAVFEAYRVMALPTTLFIDAQGVIRDVVLGEMSQADMRERLDRIKTW